MIKKCEFCFKIVYSEEEYNKHLDDPKYHPLPDLDDYSDLMEAQSLSMEDIWDNDEDEVWNNE